MTSLDLAQEGLAIAIATRQTEYIIAAHRRRVAYFLQRTKGPTP